MAWNSYLYDADTRCVMVMADYQVPTYLKAFDLDADQGRGKVVVTTEIADAMVFENGEELIETWSRQSQAVPLRHDGKPNRPLTACSIEIAPAPARAGFVMWPGSYPDLESTVERRAA